MVNTRLPVTVTTNKLILTVDIFTSEVGKIFYTG